ncbi:hypothetical protein FKP32DRAFT_1613947 [Trametes sanguinea]|nr:hypothetical protein FKP32DRAFT_1613947 [Trametes sanguinea]
MWLKTYLALGMKRPTWALVLDDLMAGLAKSGSYPRRKDLRVNMFLQNWSPNERAIPSFAKDMLKVAKKYGVRQEGLAFTRASLRAMPMWGHGQIDDKVMRSKSRQSAATACLVNKHKLVTVGDFERFADTAAWEGHNSSRACACRNCEVLITSVRCANPDRCKKKAEALMNLLPAKWDPRGLHPEDYEHLIGQDPCAETEDAETVDRRIATDKHLADSFRIFTEERGPLTVGTDGSCTKNGEAKARAGAGIFVDDSDERNRAIKLPSSVKQSNQTAEIIAIALAAKLHWKR